ncbi:hypothetical protein DM02DRAFT_633910 [Periconia macrospinosa]|uniref:Uncharacterized protein n=1 Tax=Periconia macrospinosa TaxID=97972 RepID=A0A2V1DAJ6_9PLEO|nr:hypothetical protein DM02DRAFT_633910 [Periconia macrospinosa]
MAGSLPQASSVLRRRHKRLAAAQAHSLAFSARGETGQTARAQHLQVGMAIAGSRWLRGVARQRRRNRLLKSPLTLHAYHGPLSNRQASYPSHRGGTGRMTRPFPEPIIYDHDDCNANAVAWSDPLPSHYAPVPAKQDRSRTGESRTYATAAARVRARVAPVDHSCTHYAASEEESRWPIHDTSNHALPVSSVQPLTSLDESIHPSILHDASRQNQDGSEAKVRRAGSRSGSPTKRIASRQAPTQDENN